MLVLDDRLCPFDFGDIQEDHSAQRRDLHAPVRTLSADQQAQVAPLLGWVSAQGNLDGLLLARGQHPREAGEQGASVRWREPRGQQQVERQPSLHPQQLGGGQVHLRDLAQTVDRGIGHRGKVVEVRVAVAGLLKGLLGVAQLPILELQFDLVDLKVLDRTGGVRMVEGLAAQGGEQFGQGALVDLLKDIHWGPRGSAACSATALGQ